MIAIEAFILAIPYIFKKANKKENQINE